MENVSLSVIHLRRNKEIARTSNQTFLNIQPDFQREYESWDGKLKTRLIESILLSRAMNPIWTVRNEIERSDEVLDGMHRLTTALKFLENEFALTDHFTTLPTDKYLGKKFDDLSIDDQDRIRSYNFSINKLDSSYRRDVDKLMDMYAILNRSSKPLNEFEFKKLLLLDFYRMLSSHCGGFLESIVYEPATTTRGKLETVLIKLLALTQDRLPDSFNSLNELQTQWQHDNLGETHDTVHRFITTKGKATSDTLDRLKRVMDTYLSEGLFPSSKHLRRKLTLPAFVIIARSVALIKTPALFSRHLPGLITRLREQVIEVENLQLELDCVSRNGGFQRKLVHVVDNAIHAEIGDTPEPRLFSAEMISRKLEDQKHVCPLCSLEISSNQKYEGDHIIPWTSGGKTVSDNLQVVHMRCHKRK